MQGLIRGPYHIVEAMMTGQESTKSKSLFHKELWTVKFNETDIMVNKKFCIFMNIL